MLFESTDDIKSVFSAPNINNELGSILSYVDRAIVDFVLPYLSQAQYDKLLADLGDDEDDAAHLKLLKKVRTAVIHFAYYYYADDGDMQIGDRGFMRIEQGEEKTAYSGQIQKFKRARLRDGWAAIEDMLRLLQSDKTGYALWASSDEYKDIKSFFIWNTRDYRKYRMIKNLGVLDAMEGCAVHVQDEIIRANVGDTLYAELKAQLLADNYSADNALLVPFIQKAIAHLIVARGIEEGILDFSEEGVTLVSFEDKDRGGVKQTTADAANIQRVKTEATAKGQAAIKELRNFLNANASATKYASYYSNENLYDDPTDTTDQSVFENKEGGTYFAV